MVDDFKRIGNNESDICKFAIIFFMCSQLLLISSFYYQSFPSPSELPLTCFLGTLIDSKIVFF